MSGQSRLSALITAIGADVNYLIGYSGPPSINAQTGTTYTLQFSDFHKWVSLSNAGAITVTIPPNSTTPYPIGTEIEGHQEGVGQVTIVGGSGVTVTGSPGLKTADRYSVFGIKKMGTNTWLAYGRLAT